MYLTNLNTITSFIFLSNVYHLYNKDDEIYMYSFIMLFLSSILYHETYNKSYKKIDALFVINIIFQGGYRTFIINNYTIYTNYTIICFILTLYSYNFKKNNSCNHSCIHILSSIGHHMIIANKDN